MEREEEPGACDPGGVHGAGGARHHAPHRRTQAPLHAWRRTQGDRSGQGQAPRHTPCQPHARPAMQELPRHHQLAPPLPQAQEPGGGPRARASGAGLGVGHHLRRQPLQQHVPLARHRRILQEDSRIQSLEEPGHGGLAQGSQDGLQEPPLSRRAAHPPLRQGDTVLFRRLPEVPGEARHQTQHDRILRPLRQRRGRKGKRNPQAGVPHRGHQPPIRTDEEGNRRLHPSLQQHEASLLLRVHDPGMDAFTKINACQDIQKETTARKTCGGHLILTIFAP